MNTASANPFPGLRPFRQEEDYLFFGREQQTVELLARLNQHRFLAVVGTSGSGKSSLVRAGLLPALQGGNLNQAGSTWEIVVLRPGGDPVANLTRAMLEAGLYDAAAAGAAEALLATLRRSGLGLAEAVRQSDIESNANLLVVVDQFEELFRYSQTGPHQEEEAAAFVELLLEASRQSAQRTYVCITMRSDYLGDCAQFRGLAEAVNEGEYLIPRLTRQQRRAAIEGPVKVGGAQIAPRLVQRLMNDVGDDPDQLPILQHALMRTWERWAMGKEAGRSEKEEGGESEKSKGEAMADHGHQAAAENLSSSDAGPLSSGLRPPSSVIPTPPSALRPPVSGLQPPASAPRPLDIEDYEATGGVREALSRHADEVFEQLPSERHRIVAEKLFRALTERGADNRGIRRPTRLDQLCAIAGATLDDALVVIEAFRRQGRTFLMPMEPAPLGPSGVIDISHETLMRVWRRLRDWVETEAQSARVYRRLADTAALYQEGKAGLFHDPDLQIAVSWRAQAEPNAAWAERYHQGFDRAIAFLEQSEQAERAEAEAREAARQREVAQSKALAEAERLRAEEQLRAAVRLRWLVRGLGLVAMIAVAALISATFARNEARTQARRAEQNSDAAQRNAREAEQQSRRAEAASKQAESLLAQYQREEGRAWLSRAQTYHEQKNFFYARLMAGRALGFDGAGRANLEVARQAAFPILLGSSDPERKQAEEILRTGLGHDLLWQSPLGDLHESPVNLVAYSLDGKLLATASVHFRNPALRSSNGDVSIRLWNLASGKPLAKVEGRDDFTTALQFSPDSRTLVAVSETGFVRIIDTQTGAVIRGFETEQSGGPFGRGYALHPDNRILAAWAGGASTIQIWDLQTGARSRSLVGHTNEVHAVAFHPGRSWLATSGRDLTVRIWNYTSGDPVGEPLKLETPGIYSVLSLTFRPGTDELAIGLIGGFGSTDKQLELSVVDLTAKTKRRFRAASLGSVARLVYTPDGQTLAALDFKYDRLRIFDANSGEERAAFPFPYRRIRSIDEFAFSADGQRLSLPVNAGIRTLQSPFTTWPGVSSNANQSHRVSVRDVGISPDGRTLASADEEGSIRLWETASGRSLGVLTGHEQGVHIVSFGGDGKTLVSVGTDSTLRVWDVASGKSLRTLRHPAGPVLAAGVNASGNLAASGNDSGSLMLWNLASGQTSRTISAHTNAVRSIALSPDGLRLASAAGASVRVWDAVSGASLSSFNGHSNEVSSVTFSPDGNSVASAAADHTILIWDAATGAQRRSLAGHSDTIHKLAFAPNGELLASASADGSARVWQINSGKLLAVYEGHREAVTSAVFGPDSSVLATASADGQVRLWQFAPTPEAQVLRSNTSGAEEIVHSPDGRLFACAFRNGTILVWDRVSKRIRHTLVGHTNSVWTIAFSSDSSRLASGSADGSARIWDFASGTQVALLNRESVGVGGVAFSPDGQLLALGADNGKVQLWKTQDLSMVKELIGHRGADPVHVVVFSPDGRRLLSGGNDRKILLWDVETGVVIREDSSHRGVVYGVAFAPDGSRYASASGDNQIKIWDAASGRELMTLAGHLGVVHAPMFHPHAPILASASSDGTIRLWNLETGTEINALAGHPGGSKTVSISPDGKTLVSGASDGALRIWKLADLIRDVRLAPVAPYMAWATLDGRNVSWKGSSDHLYASLESPWFQANPSGYLSALRGGLAGDALERDLFQRFLEAGNWIAAQLAIDRIAGDSAAERQALSSAIEQARTRQREQAMP